MSEYGKELLSRVQKEFANLYAKDKKIKAITKKLANNSQSYEDANLYSIRVGELLSKSLLDNINENTLSGNFISRELADEILRPTLTNNYEMIKQAVLTVQTNQNKASNIGLQPQVADLNTSRIDGLINKVSSYDTLDKGKWVLGEPVVNYSQAVVDDSEAKNMETYSKAGMDAKIVREAEPGACRWCKALAGTYDYARVKATGSDVYRRHESCRCLVTYQNGKKRQDVWNKAKWEVEEDKERKKYLKNKEKSVENKNNEILNDRKIILSNNDTDHIKERKKERNISDQAINSVIKNPLHKTNTYIDEKGRPYVQYIGEKITVIVNPDTGAKITVIKTPKSVRNKWKKKK